MMRYLMIEAWWEPGLASFSAFVFMGDCDFLRGSYLLRGVFDVDVLLFLFSAICFNLMGVPFLTAFISIGDPFLFGDPFLTSFLQVFDVDSILSRFTWIGFTFGLLERGVREKGTRGT